MDDICNKDIGRQAEKILKDHGIKKKFVSEQTGIPYSSLISKLKGHRSMTVVDVLLIAKVANVNPQEFIPTTLD
jgi:predicted transcriptional regulator